uniref:Nose resistant to fluoxetine protein 6 n=1 Tax=Aceria tosichella TaxID=561515 RepID=A0A6G1SEX8_9ACAR
MAPATTSNNNYKTVWRRWAPNESRGPTASPLLSVGQSSLSISRHSHRRRSHGAEQERVATATTTTCLVAESGRVADPPQPTSDELENSVSIGTLGSRLLARAEPGRFRCQCLKRQQSLSSSWKVDRCCLVTATCCGSSRSLRASLFPFRGGGSRCLLFSKLPLVLFAVFLLSFLTIHTSTHHLLVEARSIDGSAPPNGRIDTIKLSHSSIADSNNNSSQQAASNSSGIGSQFAAQQTNGSAPTASPKSISTEAISDLIERVTSVLFSTTTPTTSRPSSGEQSSTVSSLELSNTVSNDQLHETTTPVSTTPNSKQEPTTHGDTTTTTISTTITTTEASDLDEDEQDGSSGAGNDDNDAEDCQGLSSGPSAPGKGPTDNERLVNLQACLQKKIKKQLMSSARSSMELFDQLSLSGACSASLMNAMSSLGELKSFAFKFLDASAKIPSGVMSGLLSDFGDFEQCLSIRSNPLIEPQDELEEGGYSGKYCLVNVKMRYRIQLGPNATAPEGIYPDGVLWDELVRHYWTSNSSKGVQVGVCVPSKCNRDDLEQILNLTAESYHVHGELGICQDSNDLRRQQEPDQVQQVIIYAFLAIFALNLLGTCLTRRYHTVAGDPMQAAWDLELDKSGTGTSKLATKLLACFSIQRNWHIFLGDRLLGGSSHRDTNGSTMGVPIDNLDGLSPDSTLTNRRPNNKSSRWSISLSSDTMDTRGTSGTQCIEPTIVGGCESHTSFSGSFLNSSGSSGADLISSGGISNELKKPDHNGLEFIDGQPAMASFQPLTVKIVSAEAGCVHPFRSTNNTKLKTATTTVGNSKLGPSHRTIQLGHLWGLKLLVIIWITVGHSFLYPSANNYQHYRSIINMKITRNSVWFATTNFILGIDMLLYMTGLTFVYKLAGRRSCRRNHHQIRVSDTTNIITNLQQQQATSRSPQTHFVASHKVGFKIVRFIMRKVLRFWPTYLSVIALAIVLPLVSSGPMWPEMVSRRLGETCRANWWANLLMINNFLDASRVCLPSSWFISVIMQCFLIGSGIVALANRRSQQVAMVVTGSLICLSSSISFWLAYTSKLNAPAIRMDESFVMELDDNIFRMYTSTLNNLGPFLVGMLGGFILLKWKATATKCSAAILKRPTAETDVHKQEDISSGSSGFASSSFSPIVERLSNLMFELNLAFAMALVALVVLSSVFFTSYTPFWSALYWSCHRVGWALVTGYLIHQCATGKWHLIRELLSLSTFIPLGRLIFIAYLVYPMFIHIHSGLVRDGLHVSLYNMLNIYITRLVMSFALALVLHLLIELPFCSLEETLLSAWLQQRRKRRLVRRRRGSSPTGNQQAGYKTDELIHTQGQRATLQTERYTGDRQEASLAGDGVAPSEPLLAMAPNSDTEIARVIEPVRQLAFERQETTETVLSANE